MNWDKTLFLYVCLPLLVLAGVSYAIYQVTAPDQDVELSRDSTVEVRPAPDKGYTRISPEPPRRSTVIDDRPWMSMVTLAIGGLAGLISAAAGLLRAITAFRRQGKS